jgi:hypothetical protein
MPEGRAPSGPARERPAGDGTTDVSDLPANLLIALARRRGLALDAGRAAALRPLAGSLFSRLARIGETLPRDAAPPASGTLGDRVP